MSSSAVDLRNRLENMTDREILIETRVITQNLCKKVDEVKDKQKAQDERMDKQDEKITNLEKHDVAADAVQKQNKDTTATIVAIAALIISLVATAANLLGG